MPQVINTNLSALNAQRQLDSSGQALSTSLARLSSGLRINSARDDAAGLAISTRFTSSIQGLSQASRNANDAISLAQVSEGALQEYTKILQRSRELAIQSANGTNTSADRQALQSEVNQLKQELTRIATTTTFNGLNVLNGELKNTLFQVGSEANQTVSVSVADTQTSAVGANQIRTNNTKGIEAATRTESLAGGTAVGEVGSAVGQSSAATGNGYAAATYTVRNTTSSGSVTSATTSNVADDSARTIASNLNALTGVSATAFNKVTLSGISAATTDDIIYLSTASDGSGSVDLTGGALSNLADTIATTINANTDFAAAGVYAVSTGTTVDIFATQGHNLSFEKAGAGGGVTVTSAFDGGEANAITTAATDTRGGRVDIYLTQGYTLESSVADDVFNAAANTAFTTTAAGATTKADGNSVGAQTLTITGPAGSATVAVSANQTADSIATAVNNVSSSTGVEASARTTLRIDSVSADGTVTFDLYGNNSSAVSIVAAVTTSDLTELVNSINDKSGETGITANLGTTDSQIIMTMAEGKDIAIENFTHSAAVDYQAPTASNLVSGSGSSAPTVNEVNMVVTGNPAASTATADTEKGNYLGTSVTLYDGGDRNGQDSTVVGGELTFSSKATFSITSNIDGAGATGQSLFKGIAGSSTGSTLNALNTVDISTADGAQDAITVLDQAINIVSGIRADLGAVQSRFQSAINNLNNNVENLSAARSRILDTDFAAETASLTRNQILQQAGISILAQANSLPQNVLALLQ